MGDTSMLATVTTTSTTTTRTATKTTETPDQDNLIDCEMESETKQQNNCHLNDMFFEQMDEEFARLTRRPFFLYTIDEHETFANKMFTVRKKLDFQRPNGGGSIVSSLSKSDTNLATLKY